MFKGELNIETGLSSSWSFSSNLLIGQHTRSNIAAGAAEGDTELTVMMREVKNSLRQVGRLNNAADLDGPFLLDELPDEEEQLWRELQKTDSQQAIGGQTQEKPTSEYHLYCQAVNRIRALSMLRVSPCFSYNSKMPFIALGENRTDKQWR
jgi:hypothetical protein